MIIASDLDRTLMYSMRALEELGRPEDTVLKPVEINDGNWVGYMTETCFFCFKAGKPSILIYSSDNENDGTI